MSKAHEITVKLRRPVRGDDGKTIRELTFREPTVDDMLTAEAIGGGELRATVAMLASMAGVEMSVMKQITRSDFQRITEAVAPLLDDSAAEVEAQPGGEEREMPEVASAA